jgi:hypothetical protein
MTTKKSLESARARGERLANAPEPDSEKERKNLLALFHRLLKNNCVALAPGYVCHTYSGSVYVCREGEPRQAYCLVVGFDGVSHYTLRAQNPEGLGYEGYHVLQAMKSLTASCPLVPIHPLVESRDTTVLAPEVLKALIAEGYEETRPPYTPDGYAVTSFEYARKGTTTGRKNLVFIHQSRDDGGHISLNAVLKGNLAHRSYPSVLTLDCLLDALNEKCGSMTVCEAMTL